MLLVFARKFHNVGLSHEYW